MNLLCFSFLEGPIHGLRVVSQLVFSALKYIISSWPYNFKIWPKLFGSCGAWRKWLGKQKAKIFFLPKNYTTQALCSLVAENFVSFCISTWKKIKEVYDFQSCIETRDASKGGFTLESETKKNLKSSWLRIENWT